MATRYIIAGSKGQLGRALGRALGASSEREIAASADLPDLDIADADSVAAFLADAGPADFLVNAAAFTHVDRCETERATAHRVNAVGPGVLAAACADAGIALAHVSTDYVFAGDSEVPYREDDETAPVSAYGQTKREGEERVLASPAESLIVRTSWVFGEGRNFIGAMIEQGRARRAGTASGPMAVVDDQRGRPTYAEDLAAGLVALLEGGARGVYHLANAGVATWWDLARFSLDHAGFADLPVDRLRSDQLKQRAPRPHWSVLDCTRAERSGVALRSWQEAVRAYLDSDFSPLAPSETP